MPDRLSGRPGAFDYVRCEGCGLLQIAQTPDDLAERYQDYRVHRRESSVLRLLRRLLMGASYQFPPAGGRSLDVGCGNGWYAQEMAARGWEAHGYEPDAGYAGSLADRIGLPVHFTPQQVAAVEGGFNLVTLNFVFEHLDQPVETLKWVAAALQPGGTLIITVPDPAGREARLFGPRWFHLDPPRHLVLFTRDQLSGLLQEVGLRPIAARDLPAPTGFAGSFSYLIANQFHPIVWYLGVLPGLVFSTLVRDGLFRIEATKPVLGLD